MGEDGFFFRGRRCEPVVHVRVPYGNAEVRLQRADIEPRQGADICVDGDGRHIDWEKGLGQGRDKVTWRNFLRKPPIGIGFLFIRVWVLGQCEMEILSWFRHVNVHMSLGIIQSLQYTSFP